MVKNIFEESGMSGKPVTNESLLPNSKKETRENNQGMWVSYKGEKYWLSKVDEGVFKVLKEQVIKNGLELENTFFIYKDPENTETFIEVGLDEIELWNNGTGSGKNKKEVR